MTRAARAVIDLDALRHNLQRAKAVNPKAKQYAVIKANAYGHGMVSAALALEDADGFAVASLDEALELRAAGIKQTILLLEGFFQADELEQIQHYDLEIVVHHAVQLDSLESTLKNISNHKNIKPIIVWLKVDTGMRRLGFEVADVSTAWQRLVDCPLVAQPPRLMTHLANADDFHSSSAQDQIETFKTLLPGVQTERSIANSAGILGWLGSHADMDRPGIMLYGVSPFLNEEGAARRLRPVMTLCSELIAVKHCKQGDAIGYGSTWLCPEDMPIGVVSIGYGDGYPRHAPSGTPVLVNGQRVPLIGRVSMDMICVGLRDQPRAQIADPVVLWGEGLPVEEIAHAASAIAYELFCNVTERVRREYINA